MGTNSSFGSVRKLPSGRFQVRYFHLGRRISADKTFATKADARAFLAGVETDLKRGNYVDPSAGRITFGEYAGWWIEQRPLRPRTRETYDGTVALTIGWGPSVPGCFVVVVVAALFLRRLRDSSSHRTWSCWRCADISAMACRIAMSKNSSPSAASRSTTSPSSDGCNASLRSRSTQRGCVVRVLVIAGLSTKPM